MTSLRFDLAVLIACALVLWIAFLLLFSGAERLAAYRRWRRS